MDAEAPSTRALRRGAAALLLAGAVLACTPPAKVGDPFAAWRGSPGFDAAREACIDFAVDRTSNFDGQATASKAAIGMFLDCMAGKGFAPAGSSR